MNLRITTTIRGYIEVGGLKSISLALDAAALLREYQYCPNNTVAQFHTNSELPDFLGIQNLPVHQILHRSSPVLGSLLALDNLFAVFSSFSLAPNSRGQRK